MYEDFYRLSGSPFQLTPDSRFFFESRVHGRAIAHLTFGLAQGEGFVVITGEVGAGKTTLVERLWSQLDRDSFVLARINTTQLSGDDLFRMAMAGFAVETAGADKATMLLRFEETLRRHRLAGRRCLLVVDEAQNLSVAALEELRMLSNITEDGRASLQTILLGQPQFRRMLASPELDQLRQRVLASFHLGPLSQGDSRAYVEHRLSTVGWDGGNPSWDDDAFAAVHRHSGGIPRRINRLCARVLIYGALEQVEHVSPAMVDSTADELDEDLEGGGGAAPTALAPAPQPPEPVEALRRELSQMLSQDSLERRVTALERQVAQREQVFLRLLDVLGSRQ
jgi:putative secretion ATPase (PEP-CTERM system associated)